MVNQEKTAQDSGNFLVVDWLSQMIDSLVAYLSIPWLEEGNEWLFQQVTIGLFIEDKQFEGWRTADDESIPDAGLSIQVDAQMIVQKNESLVDVEDVA